jgi:hypothetical protein
MQNLVSEEALFPSNIINKPNKKKMKGNMEGEI